MNEFALIFGMALVTFAIRYPVLALVGKIPLPERMLQALRYVPPAVLAAIIVPAVLIPEGTALAITPQNARLAAALAAIIVAWRTKNLLLTIIVGMAALWVWTAFIPGA